MRIAVVILLAGFLVSGCSDTKETTRPDPVALTAEAVGHFCQMFVLDHSGPKAQVHLAGQPAPLWFAQVRDAVAFLREPEKSAEITAVYVNDMARPASWEDPGADNWISADKATFVVGSDAIGGMGAPEVVPFGTEDAAMEFVAEHGGNLMRLSDIPNEAVLGAVDMKLEEGN